ncbi:hypothetical protein ASG52_11765 [Methylobacterium sp. Leaf456]|uniref:hypothetical protein n=1 Tax=Methylobacterium sp. Leaf456 TaxID=1736382 RepID=UPI0006FA8D84|nr:hypothetical protein [Methylobacterium sp. Leaf456]KQT46411.1 hypothetical protein ASG52_11765 [Methylobacterium sp. Leaf456]
MDATLATTWAICALGLAVAGWAAAGTPRVAVSTVEHHGGIPRVRGASHNTEIAPSVTFVVTPPATSEH